MRGQTISHYKILEELGEGGMGVVYKAEDTRLNRIVALKFLPPDLARNEEAKTRFIHEAQAASALDHPNICDIHDIGETDDGQIFICMACYEGETLKKKIERGPLPLHDAIEIGLQVAHGLQAAHEARMVHRDIKPANIMVTAKGEAKILDFGLAKLAGQTILTKAGSTVGTAAYASPEQAQGEEVDRRSDIFSFGVVLYEMITGRRPFRGEHEAAITYSLMNETPEPLARYKANIPDRLQRVIDKSLAKDRADRYQHIDEMLVDLRQTQQDSPSAARLKRKTRKLPLLIGAGIAFAALAILVCFLLPPKPAPTVEQSVAVIPFVDMSPQKDQDYFCDGMTEELINRLSKVQDLRVPARTSAFTFKGKTEDVREIGGKLNVRTVLEGSVRKAGNDLRITAQLINVADGYHLWSETYDRELKDVFAIQDEISGAIVKALKLKLTSQEIERISEHPIDNVTAYDLYLKAVRQAYRYDEKSLDSAFVHLQRGIDIMGDNALLYSGMAYVYWQYVNMGIGQKDYFARAEDYAQKALAMKPDLPSALVMLGELSAFQDYPTNLHDKFRYYKKALIFDPNNTRALAALAATYQTVGKPSEASALLKKLKRVDPLNDILPRKEGLGYQYECQFGHALEEFRMFYRSDSTSPLALTHYSLALVCNGKREEALAVIDRMGKTNDKNVMNVLPLLLKHALRSDKESAMSVMTADFRKTCWRDYEWSLWVAARLSLLGAEEEALDWLENAVNHGFINYPYLQCDPMFDNIRGHVRHKKLLERAKHEWEHFEVPG